MATLKIPEHIKKHIYNYDNIDEIPDVIFNNISTELKYRTFSKPIVSIVIIAYNEENKIIRSLSSLSDIISKYPFEVIVVNNNSTDRTQEVIDKCGAKSVFQEKQGVGFARQAGLDVAQGIYHLCGDADTIYPPNYVDNMIEQLQKPNISAVFGHVSFIPDGKKSRSKLGIYEFFKDMVVILRAINRPELSLGGASFGFITELGRKIGWRTDIKRGEDGSMALSLKKYGEIKRLSMFKSRIWTTARTLENDGNYISMIFKRVFRELKRIKEYFTVQQGEYLLKEENRI